jgi:hypothetical protein
VPYLAGNAALGSQSPFSFQGFSLVSQVAGLHWLRHIETRSIFAL